MILTHNIGKQYLEIPVIQKTIVDNDLDYIITHEKYGNDIKRRFIENGVDASKIHFISELESFRSNERKVKAAKQVNIDEIINN